MILRYFILIITFYFVIIAQGVAQNINQTKSVNNQQHTNSENNVSEILLIKQAEPLSVQVTANKVVNANEINTKENDLIEITLTMNKQTEASNIQVTAIKVANTIENKVEAINLAKQTEPSEIQVTATKNTSSESTTTLKENK